MAASASPPIRPWQSLARFAVVSDTVAETASALTLCFDIADCDGHLAGQHLDIRLTADDGYQASRSYSLSSGPHETPQITVERVDDGEVSPYLVDVIESGDEIELRGPIGGYFVWEPSAGRPLLIGGGSGIAPLRAIWRANTEAGGATLLCSAQSSERIIFADELATRTDLDIRIHLTRVTDSTHRAGRISSEDVQAALESATPEIIYLCGPTAFVETIARYLVGLQVDPRTIRTERFG
jgi:ferredoxin-NADP reductase